MTVDDEPVRDAMSQVVAVLTVFRELGGEVPGPADMDLATIAALPLLEGTHDEVVNIAMAATGMLYSVLSQLDRLDLIDAMGSTAAAIGFDQGIG